MKTIKRLFFPLWYASDIELTEAQKKENEQIYNDPNLFILGEDMIAWEYEQKTGRDLMTDTFLSALRLTAVIIAIITLFMVLFSSCTSMEECEETVGNQYRYEVITLDERGNEIDRQFCNSYITLYGDSMTKFSYNYCNLHKRIKRDEFELKIGTYKINPL